MTGLRGPASMLRLKPAMRYGGGVPRKAPLLDAMATINHKQAPCQSRNSTIDQSLGKIIPSHRPRLVKTFYTRFRLLRSMTKLKVAGRSRRRSECPQRTAILGRSGRVREPSAAGRRLGLV